MKGKAAVDDGAFDSNPNSARDTPIGTPGVATPASVETPVGSGDEARVAATVEGAGEELKFKAAKGRKKLTRKQLKEREDRRRARTRASHLVPIPFSLPLLLFPSSSSSATFPSLANALSSLSTVAFLSSTVPGAVREPDTDSDEENPIHAQQKLRIPSKAKRSGTSTPTIAGMRT
ncbi:hypothetical protein OF846_002642 [Rhodotorula toruloides]|nr:hypothetical protein OF846_002642 [Rhodotorula toruloides]